jgi:peptidoglycan/xylan/chitin deacetylase (PgdA/CDA1 family)
MFKRFKKHWAPKICSLVPLHFWHRLVGVEVLLPYYHLVGDQEVPHVSGLYRFRTVQQFKADLEFFLRFYTPIALQDIICHLDGLGRLPKRCFLPTFDDGFREVYDVVAPILRAQGCPAVFFLTTSVIDNCHLCWTAKKSLLIRALVSLGECPAKREGLDILDKAGVRGGEMRSRIRAITYRQRHVLDELGPILGSDFPAYVVSAQPYLSSIQISDLIRQGFAIGAHSIDHPLYSELSLEEQLAQTQDSVSWLSSRFQFKCQSFAFPFNEAGISPEFFYKAFAPRRLSVCFGSSGMRRHFFPRHLARYTMEAPDLGASQLLAREFCLTLLRSHPW